MRRGIIKIMEGRWSKDDMISKINIIKNLSAGELKGYWLYVVTRKLRPEFDGERAALMGRADVLGITLVEP